MNRAVIFDLDGTLTVPMLDFDLIREEIGPPLAGSGRPILEAVAGMGPDERRRVERILERHERLAAEKGRLNDGATDVVHALRERDYRLGVLTRNARRWTRLILERHEVVMDGVWCREDGPIKPAPDGVLALCRRFEADLSQSWMVGDVIFDIQAGASAGLKTVLMIRDGERPEYADLADHVIRSLRELLTVVESG